MTRKPVAKPSRSYSPPPRARGYTRALKNARFLRAMSPETFPVDSAAGGFGTSLPLDVLRNLHRIASHSPLLNRQPHVVEILRAHRPPMPQRGARDAMFSGTVYFAQVTFKTSGGDLVTPTSDMDTIIQYARHAIVPISEYVTAQYGVNKVSVASTPLTYTANVPTGVFSDSDLQGWVNDMKSSHGLGPDSCIYVICPQGISAHDVGGNAGYHGIADIPYIVAGVYDTGLTLQDQADVYAMVISHEMAEMVVDPKVDGQNPEVCDPCDINCNNLTRVYFDAEDNFLGINQSSPPGGFAFDYYICAVVKAEGSANCPASAGDCQYAPVNQSLEFIMGQATFAKDEVAPSSSVAPAFWLRVSGFTSEALGLTSASKLAMSPNPAPTFTVNIDPVLNAPNNLTAQQIATISANLPSVDVFGPPPIVPADPSLQQDPQNFLYPYTVTFGTQGAFGALLPDQVVFLTVQATLVVGQVTVTASANLTLTSGENPRFEDIDPNHPQNYPSWLSFDLRFLKMTVPTTGAAQTASRFGATMTTDPADAPGFIAQVIDNLTAGGGRVGSDSFDPGLTQDEDASSLEFLPTDVSGNRVFNFAIARVRLKGNTPGAKAKKVRVFFRLFQAQSTVSNFDPSTTYRYHSDGALNGVTVPLLGVQNDSHGTPEYVTVPCFATPRVCIDPSTNGYRAVSMATQPEDTPNAREIDVIPGVEVDTFFGCWLDINQPDQKFLPAVLTAGSLDGPYSGSLLSINEVISNAPHQCLIAEIRDDDTPIPVGATTANSDKLAQRNIAWIDGPNPGVFESRRNPHPFEIRATPPEAASPDELMVFWGATPKGSRASLYFPTIAASDIIALADAAYPFHQLSMVDPHTVECPTGGVTYVPIPNGVVRHVGLMTVDLPAGVKRGERYDITVRQTTARSVTVTPPPIIQRGTVARDAQDPVTYSWREILGIFQIAIVISTKEQILYPEERLYSWLLWKLKVTSRQSRWYPILRRYLDIVRGRVSGFGGDPGAIPASPTGDVPKPKHGPDHGHSDHDDDDREFTGKVLGIIHDRFGDFSGFQLLTECGHERRFEGREPAVRDLIRRAWAERLLITVSVDDEAARWPASIMIRSLPG